MNGVMGTSESCENISANFYINIALHDTWKICIFQELKKSETKIMGFNCAVKLKLCENM